MISDDELAKEILSAWNWDQRKGADSNWRECWLAVARRARELLLPKEAEAVLKAALDYQDYWDGSHRPHQDASRTCDALTAAARAYRAAQPPQERTLIFPDASGHAIKETDYPDLMAMLKEWRQKREAK